MEQNKSNEVYQVSARKYRPTTFASVVGQQSLTHTLKSAIDSGRLAHAYLFCGPRGVGKTTCARIFAKSINCLSPRADGEACGECESCRAFDEQRSFNINELDAASNNSVEDIRSLIDQVRIPPQIGKYRVFIIDEVHMLSSQAFNAFLKTLEEPPAHAIFILATTEKHKILPTIISRCQIYDFARITVPDIVEQLRKVAADQGISAEESALGVIAQKADGAMRDALSIFDQIAASSEGKITYQSTIANLNVLDHDYYFRLVDAFLKVDVPQALLIYKDIRNNGFDSRFFVAGLANHLRNLMVAGNPATCCLLETSDDVAKRYAAQAATIHPNWHYIAMDLCNTCDLKYPEATNKQFLVELTLVKLCQIMNPNPKLPGGGGGGGTQPLRALKSAAQSTPNPVKASPASAPQPAATPQANIAAPAPQPAAAAPSAASHTGDVPPPPSFEQIMGYSQSNRAQQKPAAAAVATPSATYSAAPKRPHTGVKPFTSDDVLNAWDKYINAHPQQKVVISTMIACQPQQVSETNFRITVESPAQVKFIEQVKPELIDFMRQQLDNDAFNLELEVAEMERKIMLSNTEIMRNLCRDNKGLRTLAETLKLRLT